MTIVRLIQVAMARSVHVIYIYKQTKRLTTKAITVIKRESVG